MQNKLAGFLRQQNMLSPGDTVICAISGGADSVAMTFAFYLLKDQLGIKLEAAHFNHHLRGEESDRDQKFVEDFCAGYGIPLHLGGGEIVPGKKGLEAAARDARYAFLHSLPGKIATAHTADDNAETVLMRMIRGTGLKGLGAISPVSGDLVRPMLTITRAEVEEFLAEWSLPHVEDSSNEEDTFLRNRIRHQIMPLLYAENPKIGEKLSYMALGLRLDESCLADGASVESPDVETLKTMHPALRRRWLAQFLRENGVREPEEPQILAVEGLLVSPSPSARVNLPGNVTIGRVYDRLARVESEDIPDWVPLTCPGAAKFGSFRVTCFPAEEIRNEINVFTVVPKGTIGIRSRREGDSLRLPGGTKKLKKAFIDRKLPAAQRSGIPVLCDEAGLLGVYAIGVNRDRAAQALPAVTIIIERINEGE